MAALLLLAGGAAATAHAECFNNCYNNYASCAASGLLLGQCAGERDLCLQQCRGATPNPPPRPLVPSASWAYIVFDSATGKFGKASGTPNGQAAMARARAQCAQQGGKSCDWRLSARDGCVAVAGGTGDGGMTGWQTSRGNGGRAVLQQKILAECRRLGGRQCAIRAEVCSWD
jgi:hypothetical protein